jgi:hypothetical protein
MNRHIMDASSQPQRNDPFGGGLAVKRPMPSDDRLILPFVPTMCCSAGPGLDPGADVPPALLQRGVTPDDWQRFMQKLQEDVQSKQWSGCGQVRPPGGDSDASCARCPRSFSLES